MKGRYKLAVCAMAAAMAFSITAYADGTDPKEVYNAAVKKSADLKSFDVYSYIAVTVSDGKQVANSGATVNAKLKMLSPSATQYLAVLTNSSEGIPKNTETLFYHDGYYYTNLDDSVKTKFALNIKDFLKSAQGMNELVPNLYNPDYNSDITMKTEGTDTILSFHLMPKQSDNYMDETLMENGGINGEYTINSDGYFSDMKFYGTFNSMELFGEPTLIAYIYETKINNPGQPFNIDFPDMSKYRDISAMISGDGPSDDDSWIYNSRQYGPAEEAELKAMYQNNHASDDQNAD